MSDIRRCSIEYQPDHLVVHWSQRNGGLAGPLGIAVAVVLPGMAVCVIPFAAGQDQDWAGTIGTLAACAGLPLLLGALGAFAAAGRQVTLHLSRAGLVRTARYPLGYTRSTTRALPVYVRTVPLLGSADQLEPGSPQEWLLSIGEQGGEPFEVLTIDAPAVANLRRAAEVVKVRGVVVIPPDHAQPALMVCGGCSYDLSGLVSTVCPECGTLMTAGQAKEAEKVLAQRSAGPATSPPTAPPPVHTPLPPPLPGPGQGPPGRTLAP